MLLLWNADLFVFMILLKIMQGFSAVFLLLRNTEYVKGIAEGKLVFVCLKERGGGGIVKFPLIPRP